jgi:hypothetical protein
MTQTANNLLYLLDDGPPKVASMLTSVVIAGVTVPLLYAVIWYERFGDDAKRTLLNPVPWVRTPPG